MTGAVMVEVPSLSVTVGKYLGVRVVFFWGTFLVVVAVVTLYMFCLYFFWYWFVVFLDRVAYCRFDCFSIVVRVAKTHLFSI